MSGVEVLMLGVYVLLVAVVVGMLVAWWRGASE